MRIRKQYQVIPTNAKLENGDSTSATNGYVAEYINEHSVVVNPTEPTTDRKKVWLKHSSNLFDKTTITENSYISATNGTISSNSSWSVSDYIDLTGIDIIVTSGDTSSTIGSGVYGIYYDSSKNVLSAISYSSYKNATLKVPSGAKYVRFSIYGTMVNTFKVVVNDKTYILDNDTYEAFEPQNEIYSTSETRIGTWIDGKSLYRKVLVITSLVYSTTTNIDIGARVDFGIVKECYFVDDISSPTFSRPIGGISDVYNPDINDSASLALIQFSFDKDAQRYQLTYRLPSRFPRFLKEMIVVVEYTKTTD